MILQRTVGCADGHVNIPTYQGTALPNNDMYCGMYFNEVKDSTVDGVVTSKQAVVYSFDYFPKPNVCF